MPLDLSDTLVVGISATALFDFEEADRVFREKYDNDPNTAIEEYRQYMLKKEAVMSRNSPDTGVRVLNTIRTKGLPISRSAFTAGETVVDYLEAFDVDLFLTTSIKDAQKVIDNRVCCSNCKSSTY